MPDYRAMARAAGAAEGLDVDRFERQIGQESGFDPDAHNDASDADGIAQIVVRWHPSMAGKTRDPAASLAYAAGLMRGHLDYWQGRGFAGDVALGLALSSYNAGRQATIDGLAGKKAGWPFAETVRYLARILDVTEAEARAILTGRAATGGAMKLSEVLARARSRIGDPYVWGGKVPPRTDCSGFVAWCYDGKVTSFTDTILSETQRIEQPAPGDIVLWEYTDPDQQGVRFPHVGLYLSDAETLDNRYGLGVGVHPQLARARAARYYRRLPGVIVDTVAQPPAEPAPAPLPPAAPAASKDAETIAGLRVAVAYLADDVIPLAVAGTEQRERALSEARRVREEFVGPKPAAARAPSSKLAQTVKS